MSLPECRNLFSTINSLISSKGPHIPHKKICRLMSILHVHLAQLEQDSNNGNASINTRQHNFTLHYPPTTNTEKISQFITFISLSDVFNGYATQKEQLEVEIYKMRYQLTQWAELYGGDQQSRSAQPNISSIEPSNSASQKTCPNHATSSFTYKPSSHFIIDQATSQNSSLTSAKARYRARRWKRQQETNRDEPIIDSHFPFPSQCELQIMLIWSHWMHNIKKLVEELQLLAKSVAATESLLDESLLIESCAVFVAMREGVANQQSVGDLLERIQTQDWRTVHTSQQKDKKYSSTTRALALTIVNLSLTHHINSTSITTISLTPLKSSAKMGSKIAQFILAHCYQYGRGITKNTHNAIKWYKHASSEPNPFPCALYAHGYILLMNDNVQQAHDLFYAAAQFQVVPAYQLIAECCLMKGFLCFNEKKAKAFMELYKESVLEVTDENLKDATNENHMSENLTNFFVDKETSFISQMHDKPTFTPCSFMKEKSEPSEEDLLTHIQQRRKLLMSEVKNQGNESQFLTNLKQDPPHLTEEVIMNDRYHDKEVQTHEHQDIDVIVLRRSEYTQMIQELAKLRSNVCYRGSDQIGEQNSF